MATKAELEEQLAELQSELDNANNKLDDQQTELDAALKQCDQLAAANEDLHGALDAAKKASAAAPAAGETFATITPTHGVLAIADCYTIDQQWKHPSKSTRGFAVDFWGEEAEYYARRMIPNKRQTDGIVQLADGVWRVKCTDNRQARVIHDHARHNINANDLTDKTFVKVTPLGATSVKALDVTRENGLGIVPVLGLVALQAKTVGVAAHRNAEGVVTQLVLTPQA
jgi:hypothetical protein